MKKFLSLSLLVISTAASADWVKMSGLSGTSPEKFIDTGAIRQTGPMNIMRRVWEISNFTNGASNKALSIKNYMEYDCKDRRIRVLEESSFSEHWAQGENLTVMGSDIKPGNWSVIRKGSVSAAVFDRVCPNG